MPNGKTTMPDGKTTFERSTDGAGTETAKFSIPVIDLPKGGEMSAQIYKISGDGNNAGTGGDYTGYGAGVGFSFGF